MKLSLIIEKVSGTLVTQFSGEEIECKTAFTSDLMSDVLTIDAQKTLLITGLVNLQTVRTAEMSDIECVILARNKRASTEMIALANKCKISLVESPFSVFRIAGLLYENGLKPLY